jgi:hypothetical protein
MDEDIKKLFAINIFIIIIFIYLFVNISLKLNKFEKNNKKLIKKIKKAKKK